MESNKSIDECAAARTDTIWQRFLNTGDLDTLYNSLFFLSLDLEDARRRLRKFDSLMSQADSLRQRNYRLVQKVKFLVENQKSSAYEISPAKKKGKNQSRKIR